MKEVRKRASFTMDSRVCNREFLDPFILYCIYYCVHTFAVIKFQTKELRILAIETIWFIQFDIFKVCIAKNTKKFYIFTGYISYSKWKSYEDDVEGERSEKNNFFFIYQD